MTHPTYASVQELTRHISEDAEFPRQLEETLRRKKLVKKLMALRAAKDVSQQEMADKLGCSQSRISKLESCEDADWRLGDLRDYLGAMELEISLTIAPRDWSAADQVKFHAFQISDCLKRLVEVAQTSPDQSIRDGIQKFHVEALVNLMKFVVESAQNLPNMTIDTPAVVDVDSDVSSNASAPPASAATAL